MTEFKTVKKEIAALKSFDFDQNTFMGGWYIPKTLCDELIEYYEFNKKYAKPAKLFGEVKVDTKESFDLSIGADNFDVVIGQYRYYLQECLNRYLIKYKWAGNAARFNIVESYNFQKYPINGGFKKWHFENDGMATSKFRYLVFMTYMNDVEDGGTEFYYQNIKTKAEKGLTLIWPSSFTHTHRGIISNTKEKYIITGWYSFIE